MKSEVRTFDLSRRKKQMNTIRFMPILKNKISWHRKEHFYRVHTLKRGQKNKLRSGLWLDHTLELDRHNRKRSNLKKNREQILIRVLPRTRISICYNKKIRISSQNSLDKESCPIPRNHRLCATTALRRF